MSLSKEKKPNARVKCPLSPFELKAIKEGAIMIKDPRKRRKCPLCNQNMYLYNIDLEDKILMCENIQDCVFPFGHELLQIVRDESELVDKPQKCTPWLFEYPRSYRPPIFKDLQLLHALFHIGDVHTGSKGRSGDVSMRLKRELQRRQQEEERKKLKRLEKLTDKLVNKLIKLDSKLEKNSTGKREGQNWK